VEKPTPTQFLVKYISSMKFEDLPSAVVDQAKDCLLDFIGAALGGLTTSICGLVRDYAKLFPSNSEASVFATGGKATAPEAAFANGTVGHALELDDGNRFAMGHPGVVIIPAVLAAGEKTSATGKNLLLAMVCGYEVFGRLGRVMNPSHFNRGFHTTATLGTMGAAIAAAKILSLSENTMLNAFGIAGSFAAGISEFLANGSTTKQLHAGRAAQNGILSSYLASKGFTGPDTVLEGRHGFFKAFSDKCNTNGAFETLGAEYEIMRTYFKRHASCRHTHSAIDATLELLGRTKLDVQRIDHVSIETYSSAYDYTNNYTIGTPLSAKMSMPYCIAATILRGRAGPEEFTPESIADKEIRKLMSKVEMHVQKELDDAVPKKRPAIVTINANAHRFSGKADLPKGDPENPLSQQEFEDKFRSLAARVLDERRIARTMETVSKLDAISDVNELTEVFRVSR
jgi:2-methylcitrate dehydratase PrpD